MRTDVLSLALAGLCIVAIAVLAALGQPVPEVLVTVALVAVGAGTGAAVPQLPALRAGKHTDPSPVDALPVAQASSTGPAVVAGSSGVISSYPPVGS